MGKDDSTLAPTTLVRYQVLALCCVLAVIVYVQRIGFAQAGPTLKVSLDLTKLEWSVILGAFMVAYGVGEVPCGLISDRLGSRHLMTLLVVGWSCMTACVVAVAWLPATTAWPFLALLFIRTGFGLFQAGTFPVFSRIFADWMPLTERATAQGIIWMASRGGGALAPYVMLPLIWLCGGWQMPMLIVAGLGFGWCALFWPWFRDRPERMTSVSPAEASLIAAGRRHVAAHSTVPWSYLLRSSNVRGLCGMYMFSGVGATFFMALLPVYLKDHRHFNDRTCMLLSFLPLAAGTVACFIGGKIADQLTRRGVNRRDARRFHGLLAQVGAGLALATIGLLPESGPWVVGPLLTLAFFSNDLAQGPAWAAAADIGEAYAGTLGGLMNMSGALFVGVTMPIVGWLMDIDCASGMFLLFGVLYLTASLCWLAVDVTRPVRQPD